MSRRALVAVLSSFVAVPMLSGCFISDPVQPPVGVRQEGGVLSIIVPNCPDDVVKSASVTEMSAAESTHASSWSAAGFTGDRRRGITLGSRDWSTVQGTYQGLTWFDIELETDRHHYGTVLESPGNLDKLASLPKDAFLVDGNVMTAAEYLASVSKRFPCPPSTP